MAETKSKFAGMFSREPDPEPPAERIETPPAPATGTGRPVGRPAGKRSDPAFKQFSVLLRRDTQREAANLLREKDEGLDLSGLMQDLLADWVKRQKQ
jgi:hypothetical protein